MEVILAIVAAMVGALLMSWSVLLYEPQERLIADVLATWWIRIDDVANSATSRNGVFISDVASALGRWLNAVFGDRLISLRALAVSICLSFSSAAAFLAIIALIDPTRDPANPKIVVVTLPISVALFQAAVGKSRYALVLMSSVLGAVTIAIPVLGFVYSEFPLRPLMFPASIAVGVVFDFLVVALVRRLFIAAARSITVLKAAIIALCSAVLGAMMLSTPLLFFGYTHGYGLDIWQIGGVLASLTNLYAGVAALAFVALNVMYLLQRALWPAIARPIYALERFKLFQKRSTLFYCGATLIAFAFPAIAKALLNALSRF